MRRKTVTVLLAAFLVSGCLQPSAESAKEELVMEEESSVSDCGSLKELPMRGLACVHCMHAKAAEQSSVIVEILRRSCLDKVAVNYLVDGYFGWDEQRLLDHVLRLTEGGRKLAIEFYLYNGPGQRRWRTDKSSSWATHISPEEFRRRIRSDLSLQADYQAVVHRLLPVIMYASERGAEVLMVPGLEDNLDDVSFVAMYNLAKDVIPQDLTVRYGRSPCVNCYEGNQGGVPPGVFLEEHTLASSIRVSRGVVTNDGVEYVDQSGASILSALSPVRDQAAQKDNIFILWSAARQGLEARSTYSPSSSHLGPDLRTYQIPDATEQEEIISFLLGEH